MREVCPLCECEVGSLLEHYRLDHRIRSPEQFKAELARVKAAKVLKAEWAAFADDLNEKQSKGLITGEEWRRLADRWRAEHQTA